ncbi:MAG: hypothetical protein JXR76_29955 [Deltaproteobacteria bacterium]|nr:hypothetical protein [Deltaproteobacteria bacterium]
MNNHENIHIPAGGPPDTTPPPTEIYQKMGKDGIFAMLSDFYLRLGDSEIKGMFPASRDALMEASKKSAAFFVQICGGPMDYTSTYGPPRLRARHMPFEIRENDKQVWLSCFFDVLSDAPNRYAFPLEHMDAFKSWLVAMANWMVNRR